MQQRSEENIGKGGCWTRAGQQAQSAFSSTYGRTEDFRTNFFDKSQNQNQNREDRMRNFLTDLTV